MRIRFTRGCKASLLTLAIILGGSVVSVQAQAGGGTSSGAAAGSAVKVGKKPVRTITRPKPGTRPTGPDNSAQLEDALSLADDARQAGRDEAAERGYLLASKLVPSDPRAYLGLGYVYYGQKKYPDAERSYARAASLSRGDSEPLARLAFTYSEMQRPDEALAAARRAVTAEPADYYGYLALGYVLSLRKSYAESETAYRKSVSLAPQPLVVLHSELVRILGEQRRYADAAIEAKKAVDIDPKASSARFSYALMLQKLGQLVPSAAQYLEASRLDPKDSSSHSNVGLIYYMTERFTVARQHWSSAVSLGSTYDPDRIGILILDGKLAEAQTQLEDYTRKTPDDEDGWLMLGDVYRALGNDSAARVTDARAAQIAPEYVGLKRPNLKSLNKSSSQSGWNSPTGSNQPPISPGAGTSTAEVFIQQSYMAKNNNGKPGEPTMSFVPGDRTIHCVLDLNTARAGTKVRFVWKTVEIEGSRNEEIKTVDYVTKPQEDKVLGNLTLPRDWPTGTYKVEIYLNGTLVKTINYRVV
ncbi:MAG: tetratricopeptide repeat protein [Pyrinomonadaceae bacterium]